MGWIVLDCELYESSKGETDASILTYHDLNYFDCINFKCVAGFPDDTGAACLWCHNWKGCPYNRYIANNI
jgi:hypothetical protein